MRLRYLTGSRRGQELILSGPRVRIGRSRDNEIVLQDTEPPLSSRHHAEARFEGGRWWIVDLSSTNRTLLNDAPVDRGLLRTGDRLTFGSDILLVGAADRGLFWTAAAVILAGGGVALAAAYGLRSRPSRIEDIATKAVRSVYMVAIDEGSERHLVGTAFAIGRNTGLLATNAHVAKELSPESAGGSRSRTPIAILSDRIETARIARLWLHPQWKPGSLEHDVALLQLDGNGRTEPLQLADAATLERQRRGAVVISFGFPAASTDPWRPRGRLVTDVIGDVRWPFLAVGLSISPGTSGSPVLDERGAVVAIVVGGDFVKAPDGRSQRPSGTAANWAIAASSLQELLDVHR